MRLNDSHIEALRSMGRMEQIGGQLRVVPWLERAVDELAAAGLARTVRWQGPQPPATRVRPELTPEGRRALRAVGAAPAREQEAAWRELAEVTGFGRGTRWWARPSAAAAF